MNIFTERFRTVLIICGVISTAALGSVKLMKIQIVDSNNYTEKTPL